MAHIPATAKRARPAAAGARTAYHHGDLPAALKQAAVALMARHGGHGAAASRARFTAQGHAYVSFALEQPERFAVMFGPFGAGRPHAAAGAGRDSTFTLLSQALDDLRANGAIAGARRMGAETVVWSAVHGLASLLTTGAMRIAPDGVSAMIDRVCEDCLLALSSYS